MNIPKKNRLAQCACTKEKENNNNKPIYFTKMDKKTERIEKINSNFNKDGITKLLDAIFDFGTYTLEEILRFKKMFDPFDKHTTIVIGKPDTRQRERVLDIFYDKDLEQYITVLTNHNKLRTK